MGRWMFVSEERFLTEGPPDWRLVRDLQMVNAHRRRAYPDARFGSRITLVDAIIVLTHTFRGGQPIPCRKSADIDDSGKLDLADVIHMLMYIFVGSPSPRPPFPGCGFDATPDLLTCESFPPCP